MSATPHPEPGFVPTPVPSRALQGALARARCVTGESLLEASRRWTLLLVFLRHNGCTFCREALADLRRDRDRLERDGMRICLVLMGGGEEGEGLLRRYDLQDALRVVDPARSLYHAFGLEHGRLRQLLSWGIVGRVFSASLRGNLPGRTVGDPKQMPGVFVVRDGRVLRAFRHRTAADRPDYRALVDGLLPPPASAS